MERLPDANEEEKNLSVYKVKLESK